jgi:hypothetical protein
VPKSHHPTASGQLTALIKQWMVDHRARGHNNYCVCLTSAANNCGCKDVPTHQLQLISLYAVNRFDAANHQLGRVELEQMH